MEFCYSHIFNDFEFMVEITPKTMAKTVFEQNYNMGRYWAALIEVYPDLMNSFGVRHADIAQKSYKLFAIQILV